MLQFLNPSVLIGLVAASIPLIIHFLNRQKIKQQPFSTVHFLKQLQPREIRRLQLRQWLLLLIRTLLIVLLVLAFARPTVQPEGLAGVGERSAVAAAVIVDNSMSLDESTLQGSLFEAFRQRFLNLGAAFQGRDWVTVIQGTYPVQVLREGEIFQPEWWGRLHKELHPTVLKSDLTTALERAVASLETAPQWRKEVIILSDFQQSAVGQVNNALTSLTHPDRWHVYLIPLRHYSMDNLSIDSVEIVNRLLERHQPLKIQVRVRNHSPNQTLSSLVSLVINGKRVGQRNLSFAPGESRWVQFEPILLDAGWVQGKVELESDGLLADNYRYFTFYTPPKINILHVTPAQQSLIPIILKPALQSGYFQYQKVTPQAFVTHPVQPNTVVLLENVTEYSAAFVETLRRFLKIGGGVVFIPPEKPATNLPHFFQALKVGAFVGTWGEASNHQQFRRIESIQVNHPLFEGLFEAARRQINPIDVYAGIQWQPARGSAIPITFTDGTPFVALTPVDNGIVAVLATPVSPAFTELPFKGFVVPFMYRLIFYSATARTKKGQVLRVGQPWMGEFQNLQAPLEFTVQSPDGKTTRLQPQYRAEKIQLHFKETLQAGIYRVYKGNQLISQFAVNTWPEESAFTPVALDSLAAGLPNAHVLNPNEDLSGQIARLRSGKEIWKWLFWAALVLFVMEMVLAWTGQAKNVPQEGELVHESNVSHSVPKA